MIPRGKEQEKMGGLLLTPLTDNHSVIFLKN